MAHHEVIIAGFGGQGIMSAGNILAYAAMMEDKHVSWYPVYGPEKRGGTAACHVIVSDEPVASPILNNSATSIIIMNTPSMQKFESWVTNGGLIISDSSVADKIPARNGVDICEIPASQMASDMGNMAYANIILLGKLVAKTGMVSKENFEKALKKVLPAKKHYLIPEEMEALEAGMVY